MQYVAHTSYYESILEIKWKRKVGNELGDRLGETKDKESGRGIRRERGRAIRREGWRMFGEKLKLNLCLKLLKQIIFTESALWADSVYNSRCP